MAKYDWLQAYQGARSGTYGPPGSDGYEGVMARIKQAAGPDFQDAIAAGIITPSGDVDWSKAPALPEAGRNQQSTGVGGRAGLVNPDGSPIAATSNDPNYGGQVLAQNRTPNTGLMRYAPYIAGAAAASPFLAGAIGGFGGAFGGAGGAAGDAFAAASGGSAATPFVSSLGGGAAAGGIEATTGGLEAGAGAGGGGASVGGGAGAGVTGTGTLAGAGTAAAGALNPATAGITPGNVASWVASTLGISPGAAQALISSLGGVGAAAAALVNGQITKNDLSNLAQQQATQNSATALQQSKLNNPNVNNPYGSSQSTYDPNTGQWTVNQTLSPGQQGLLDRTTGLQTSGLDIAKGLQSQIGASLGQPYGLAGSPDRVDPSKFGAIQTGVDLGTGGIQRGLDYSGAPAMPVANQGVRDQVSKAFYDQGYNLLAPQFKDQQDSLDATLANQGIVRNPGDASTSAWQKEQDNLARSKETALNDLAQRSVISGGNAMDQLYQEQMGARQQGVGETTTQGNFANTAQGQAAQQILSAGTFANTAQGQGVQQTLASTAANNAARAQQYGEYANNRSQPLSLYNAFLSGGQPTTPTFPNPTPTAIAPTNLYTPGLAGISAQQTGYGQAIGLLTKPFMPWNTNGTTTAGG